MTRGHEVLRMMEGNSYASAEELVAAKGKFKPVAQGVELSPDRQQKAVNLIMRWIARQMGELKEVRQRTCKGQGGGKRIPIGNAEFIQMKILKLSKWASAPDCQIWYNLHCMRQL